MRVFVVCGMRGANARCGRSGKTTEGESVKGVSLVAGGWRVANSLVRREARNLSVGDRVSVWEGRRDCESCYIRRVCGRYR
jgi:hypothetical protein